ncbi:MAG: MFS transporter [Burkholderiales bacterium]|jgi:MFS family permease|nr:MFS transporter [Burkholderiales bacterium]MBP6249891.1 MFS transporter [Leptothrix sp. (in: b-proteobacteria)]MBP7519527.1 MFS transporter [Leptothrix sp. (in: b-proteobacteria)]HQY07852.1 MFS transporter [Burkholderiaceae bacterium]
MNRHLLLLALCQGLFLSNNVTFIAVNGLVGLELAPVAWMATLPVAGYVAGGALAAPLVARHQRAWGRQRTFQLGLLVALVTAAICAWAVLQRSFWLLTAAIFVAGYFNANAALYRFAATELVQPSYKEKAISWVLAGGILGGVVGPNLASLTRDALDRPFAGAYLALTVLALLAMLLMQFIRFPPLTQPGQVAQTGRPLREIVRQPVFIVAVAACALGYGVMNLLMAATPIAMAQCGHPFSAAALVLEWHVIAMYLPSFFTGNLIKRVGVWPVLVAGLLLNGVCVAIALAGVDLMHFLAALVTLGLGWNFLYIGGTTLATEAYRPEERTTAQAAVDFCVYATMTFTSFGSGALVTTGGWQAMNLGSLLPLALLAAALAWIRWRRPTTAG